MSMNEANVRAAENVVRNSADPGTCIVLLNLTPQEADRMLTALDLLGAVEYPDTAAIMSSLDQRVRDQLPEDWFE